MKKHYGTYNQTFTVHLNFLFINFNQESMV